jgi:hypothetical protein
VPYIRNSAFFLNINSRSAFCNSLEVAFGWVSFTRIHACILRCLVFLFLSTLALGFSSTTLATSTCQVRPVSLDQGRSEFNHRRLGLGQISLQDRMDGWLGVALGNLGIYIVRSRQSAKQASKQLI